MHIPDGYLSPQTYLPLYGAMFPFWYGATRRCQHTLKSAQVPFLALGAAFSFVVMMFNIPLPGGTTGHAVGGTITAIILGPWAAMISLSIALIVQALLFGDGGVTTLGANCFNMAVILPFTGYGIYHFLSGRRGHTEKGRILASGIAGYVALNCSALAGAIELGIQPMIAHTPDGQPLYAPYPLSVAVPAVVGGHLLLFGVVEGLITAAVIAYLLRTDPSLFKVTGVQSEDPVVR